MKDPKEFKSYNELIEYAQSVEDWGDTYTEKHHILPRCEGGERRENYRIKEESAYAS